MRFLKEHELPEWERKRRAGVVASIELYTADLQKHFAAAEPIIFEMMRRGEVYAAQAYRERLYRETKELRDMLVYLREMLPPFLMCRKDEILEKIHPVVANQQRQE